MLTFNVDSIVIWQVGNTSTVSANISFTLHISGEPELILENVMPFYIVKQKYELTCKSYSFPTALVWWSWLPCDPLSPASCFNDSTANVYYANNDARWIRLPFEETVTENGALVRLQESAQKQALYLNESRLEVTSPLQSGVYRCSAENKYKGPQHYQVPLLVMDSEEIFSVTLSTDEPTINDTIIVTCKASVLVYEQIHWITIAIHTSTYH